MNRKTTLYDVARATAFVEDAKTEPSVVGPDSTGQIFGLRRRLVGRMLALGMTM